LEVIRLKGLEHLGRWITLLDFMVDGRFKEKNLETKKSFKSWVQVKGIKRVLGIT